MKQPIIILFISFFLYACNGNKQNETKPGEDLKAKELLQGIWLDDDSENVLFKINGDTIYYADTQNAPVYFEIIKDSLYMYGNEVSRYQIDKQNEHIFWFHSLADNIIKLHKSENANDSISFSNMTTQVIPTYTEVAKRDTVVMYNGKRYRAYVYINPSTIKVVKTAYSEEGISVDNIYYDNIMHICVYEGNKSLYASDVSKQMFKDIIPDDFLQKSVLADMTFSKINADGYHFVATLCIPESSVCYLVNLNVSFDKKLTLNIVK